MPRGPRDSGKGVRIQGGKVYDSNLGVTCHWCRCVGPRRPHPRYGASAPERRENSGRTYLSCRQAAILATARGGSQGKSRSSGPLTTPPPSWRGLRPLPPSS